MGLRLIGLAGIFAAAQATATVPVEEPPAAAETDAVDYDHADDNRMTVQVDVDGEGPFPFIIDTGSERTVIARQLAETLNLDPSEDIMLTSIIDVQQVPTVIIPRLQFGRRAVDDIQAPALDRAHLGAEGVLGIDALEDQHILLDFAAQRMTMARAEIEDIDWPRDGTIVVRARNRFGRLVLTDAQLDGTRVYAIIDTGSSVSIGNMALRNRLVRRGRMDPDQAFVITAVTGATLRINFTVANDLTLGGVALTDLPVAFIDTELFRQLDLMDRPAILLGMNALRVFDRVAIDFANRRVRLQIPEDSIPPLRDAPPFDRL